MDRPVPGRGRSAVYGPPRALPGPVPRVTRPVSAGQTLIRKSLTLLGAASTCVTALDQR